MKTLQNISTIKGLRNKIAGHYEDKQWMIDEGLCSEEEWNQELLEMKQSLDNVVDNTEPEVLAIFAKGTYYESDSGKIEQYDELLRSI